MGRNGSWGTPVLKTLEKFEAELIFATPQNVTAVSVRKSGCNLLLLDSTVPAEQRRLLASELLEFGRIYFLYFPGGKRLLVAAHFTARKGLPRHPGISQE